MCLWESLLYMYLHVIVTLFILDTRKQVLRQTVKTQMKCRIRRHFIRVFTVCKDINNLQGQKFIHHYLEISNCDPLKYKMGKSICFLSTCMGKSIRMKRNIIIVLGIGHKSHYQISKGLNYNLIDYPYIFFRKLNLKNMTAN